MAKIKLHNPVLAANSTFGNFIVEGLVSDPTVVGLQNTGRIWFNTAEKKFKGTFINAAGDGLEVKALADAANVADLSQAIADETAARIAADNALDARITTVEDQVNGNIGDLTTLTTDAKDTLVNAINEVDAHIDQEVIDRGTAITTEATARAAADTALQAELDATQVGAGLGTNGAYTQNAGANYISTAASLNNADVILDTALKTEETARIAKDNALQTELDATQTSLGFTDTAYTATSTNYIAADATVAANIDTLDGSLKTEETARIAADNALDSRLTNVEEQTNGLIGDLTTLTTDAKDNLVNAINELDAHTDTNAADIATLNTYTDTNFLNKTTSVAQNVVADTTFNGSIDVDTNLNVDGTTTLVGAVEAGDTLTVTGNIIGLANGTFDGNVVINGDLTVSGSQTIVETEILKIADNIITLNAGIGAIDPTENAGLEVDRGNDGVSTIFQWNETLDQVEVAEDQSGAMVLVKVATATDINTLTNSTTTRMDNIQAELDATQTGAGLNTTGTYTANGAANYISTATSLKDADNKLDAALKTEETARISADNALDTRLTNVEEQTNGLIGDLTTLTTDAKDNLVNAINEVDAHIDAEVTRAVAKDNSLQAELDATQTGAGLAATGAYVATTTANYIAAATSLDNADQILDGAVKGVDNRLTTVEGQVNGNIGDLTSLTTDDKSNLVAAINEVDLHTNNLYDVVGTYVTEDATVLAIAGTNYINAATTVSAALSTLDSTLKTRGDALNTAIGITGDTYSIAASTPTADYAAVLDGTEATSNAAITKIANALAQESQNRDDADAGLDTRITTVENQVNGNIGDLTTLTTDAKDTLVNAINEVDAHIDAEVTRATTAETNLTNALSTEATTRQTNDSALATRIDNVNIAAGISGDTYTANAGANFIAGATSLVNADDLLDSTLKTTIDNYASTAAGKGTGLVGYKGYTEADVNIVNPTIEIDAGTLEAALDDIAASVNLKIHEIENRYVKGEVDAADKSDTYTIAHNLDTEFVDVSVQVYDEDDSVWRFDLVITEVIDLNTVKISLASGTASQIRYVIQGY